MNHLLIWKDMTLFWGSNSRALADHRHPVIQWVIGTEQPFLSKNKEGIWEEKKGLLIAPNHAHECDATGIHVFSLDILPESLLGEWITAQYFQTQRIYDYPHPLFSPLNIEQVLNSIQAENWDAIRGLIYDTFRYDGRVIPSSRDARIEAVIQHIQQHIHDPIDTKILMDIACLSESRLLHLFKKEVGLPIRNYILWHRLRVVFQQLLKGASLTTAAHHAGFADQAHLSRTCVKMLGIPPSLISKNSKFVQVSFPL